MRPYAIDWSATGAMLGGIASLVGSAALIVTAFLAFKSFESWKEQEKFKENRKVAIETLAIFHRGRSIIDAIRSPMTSGREIANADDIIAQRDPPIADEKKRAENMRLVVLARLRQHEEYWSDVF